MKILLLGGDGMLAYAIKQVFSFDKLIAFGRKTCDITNPYQIENYITTLRPDAVINCAAYTDVDRAETETDQCELVNAIAVEALAQVCKRADARLLHFSTEMVFGQEDTAGYVETDVPRDPVNVYGKTKLMGENYIRQTWFKHYIVRTSWMFGPGGSNFIDKVLERSRLDDKVDVVNDQWGCPTYTFDLARAVYELLHEDAPFGTYHLVNEGSTTRGDWAWEVFDYASRDCEVNRVASEDVLSLASRPKNGILVNTARKPLRKWSDAMVEYLVGKGLINAI